MNERLNNALAALAEKLGTSVDHLWAVLVRQATLEGYIALCQYAILILVSPFLFSWYKRTAAKMEDKNFDEREGMMVMLCIVIGVWSVASLVAAFSTSETITKLGNPEYWALKEILRSVGQ